MHMSLQDDCLKRCQSSKWNWKFSQNRSSLQVLVWNWISHKRCWCSPIVVNVQNHVCWCDVCNLYYSYPLFETEPLDLEPMIHWFPQAFVKMTTIYFCFAAFMQTIYLELELYYLSTFSTELHHLSLCGLLVTMLVTIGRRSLQVYYKWQMPRLTTTSSVQKYSWKLKPCNLCFPQSFICLSIEPRTLRCWFLWIASKERVNSRRWCVAKWLFPTHWTIARTSLPLTGGWKM